MFAVCFVFSISLVVVDISTEPFDVLVDPNGVEEVVDTLVLALDDGVLLDTLGLLYEVVVARVEVARVTPGVALKGVVRVDWLADVVDLWEDIEDDATD